MVEIATIFAVIGYATTTFKFFNEINNLSDKQFSDANLLLQDIHLRVTYSPDKTLVGRINAKFDRFKDFQSRWGTLDQQTLKAFANEILEGDGSVDNAIRRFHSSVYAPGGYFETNVNKIFKDHEVGWTARFNPHTNTEMKVRNDLRKFYPTLVEAEMRATTLIFFGYYLERIFSGDPYKYTTEIELAKTNHEARLTELKSKIDELEPRLTQLGTEEQQRITHFNNWYDANNRGQIP